MSSMPSPTVRSTFLLLPLMLASLLPTTAFADDAALHARARRLLAEVPLIDGHNDVPWGYRARGDMTIEALDFAGDLSSIDRPMHTDLNRLRQGGVGGQFWSVYIPIGFGGGKPGDARTVIEQIDFVKRLIDRYPDHLQLATTADEVEAAFRSGRIASLIGMEGGHSIENSLAVLRATYDLGARYMTITHSKNTLWADSATDDPVNDGLGAFGEAVIREMNRLGMLVDLSHVSEATMHDTLDVAEAPVIFSHSGARGVCDHVRNVPDAVLRRLPENGGVVMVVFLGYYVSEELRQWGVARDAERRRLTMAEDVSPESIESGMSSWTEANPRPEATVAQVVDHIDHIRDVAGIDHIGIGGDYDGMSSVPVGLEDVSDYPNLVVELLRRGYDDQSIRQILGGNVLRAKREAEQAAERLRASTEPIVAELEDLQPGIERRDRR